MSRVKVISLWNVESLDLKNINRMNHCMYAILIIKILIKFTIATVVFMGAGFKMDSSFQVVDARPLGYGQVFQFFFPGDNLTPFTLRNNPYFPKPAVLIGHTLHDPVKKTLRATITDLTYFFPNYSRLHPDTLRVFFSRSSFQTFCSHFTISF